MGCCNGFFGFTLTAPITELRFREGSGSGGVTENFGMDNVVLALPEPTGAFLLAAAAPLMLRRRR